MEVLLATAIAGVIFITLYSGFNLSLKVYKRVDESTYSQAQDVFAKIFSDLSSAYIYPEKGSSLGFVGSPNSLRFIKTAPLSKGSDQFYDYDLRQVSYYLISGEDEGSKVLVYSDSLLESAADISRQIEEGRLTKTLNECRFSYFDGQTWQASWNSTLSLPDQVKVDFKFTTDDYSTIVDVVSKYK